MLWYKLKAHVIFVYGILNLFDSSLSIVYITAFYPLIDKLVFNTS